MTSLERNIQTLRLQYGPSKDSWYEGLNARQKTAWDAIDESGRAYAEKVLWGPANLEPVLDDLDPFPGSTVAECLHCCVRHLGRMAWGLWTLAGKVKPAEDAEACQRALAQAGLVPFPPLVPVESRRAAYADGVKVLHELWVQDGCPELDKWCRLACTKHGLHLVDAIISALR